MPERRKNKADTPIPVKDAPTELSTRVGNILQGLILAASIGIVTILYDIKNELAEFNARQSVTEIKVEHLEENQKQLNNLLQRHIEDKVAHSNGMHPHNLSGE